MPIDWFTVVAQAINFLILVWLLKRFLYKPILHAIDEREKGIATQLAEAEAKKAEAQKERDDFQHKNEAFDQERAALLKKATDEAKAERQRLLDEARKDADSLRAKRQDALRNEQRNLSQEIIRWTQKEVFAITRKTLADLATTSLEERMGEVFVHRLRALTGAAKEQLAAALKTSTHPARVRSAFDLPPAQRNGDTKVRSTKRSRRKFTSSSRPRRSWSAASSSPPTDRRWPGASRIISRRWKRAPVNFCTRMPSPNPSRTRSPKPEPKAEAKPEPKAEAKPGLEPVSSAPKGTNEQLA